MLNFDRKEEKESEVIFIFVRFPTSLSLSSLFTTVTTAWVPHPRVPGVGSDPPTPSTKHLEAPTVHWFLAGSSNLAFLFLGVGSKQRAKHLFG